MRYLLIKNKKLYKSFYKIETDRLIYKSVIYNQSLPNYIRQEAVFALSSISHKNTYTKIKQRCLITNRARSVYKFFKISRIKLR